MKIAGPPKVKVPQSAAHSELHMRVREALLAAPAYFRSEIRIVGVPSTDIQNLNSILGAAIEEKVVDTLNGMRPIWDPAGDYGLYSFLRQPQTFPDVLLRRASDHHILMGIELKGWYILAKEEEPSFRFAVTPGVCAPQDLVAVYPWHLSEVISGSPMLLQPYLNHTRYIAEYRNWHWEHGRANAKHNPVIIAKATQPYPAKSDNISDHATSDTGGNFGRIARTGLMDEFKDQVNARLLSGIPAMRWRAFLKIFTQSSNAASSNAAMKALEAEVRATAIGTDEEIDVLMAKLAKIAEIL